MPRYLHPLNRAQAGVDLVPERIEPHLQQARLFGHVESLFFAELLEILDLAFQFEERLFEVEGVVGCHGVKGLEVEWSRARVSDRPLDLWTSGPYPAFTNATASAPNSCRRPCTSS